MARRLFLVLLVILLVVPTLSLASVHACSLCAGSLQTQTLRQDAGQAKMVLFGALTESTPIADDPRGGTTKLKIDKAIKPDPFLKDRNVLTLPRYVPVPDPKKPPQYLVFCDIFNGRVDPYRGMPVKSDAMIKYLEGALALKTDNAEKLLPYYFDFLEHKDAEIANDAFLEFAKANDADIGKVAGKFAPEKLRSWLTDPNTPTHRLSLYGFLLGACGSDRDALMLKQLLEKSDDRSLAAIDGILGGYIQLRPREGWDHLCDRLKDTKKPFNERFAVLRTVRFYHGWKPDDAKDQILRALGIVVEQGDIADLAVEDLRKWQMWDLTDKVLAQYGKKGFDAPIVKRGIVRYALSCPKPEAKRFVSRLKGEDPELVRTVEESLEFEKKR
ncbi:MAG: hypothetical protein AB7K24_09275 [Gemmataceae bacterium]